MKVSISFYVIIILVILLLMIIRIIHEKKIHIKLKTFFKKGFVAKRGNFGLYCYTGQQGKGKTYSLVEYIYDNLESCYFFSNIHDIKCLNDSNCIYFKGFKGLVRLKMELDAGYYDEQIKDKQVVFLFDELFSELTRNTQLSTDVLDFISQLRKRKIIFLTTAQVWRSVPLDFRCLCRYQINCNIYTLPGFKSILVKEFRDAENMKWIPDKQEFEAPIVETSITKCRYIVSQMYNTLQRITNDVIEKNENKTTIL